MKKLFFTLIVFVILTLFVNGQPMGSEFKLEYSLLKLIDSNNPRQTGSLFGVQFDNNNRVLVEILLGDQNERLVVSGFSPEERRAGVEHGLLRGWAEISSLKKIADQNQVSLILAVLDNNRSPEARDLNLGQVFGERKPARISPLLREIIQARDQNENLERLIKSYRVQEQNWKIKVLVLCRKAADTNCCQFEKTTEKKMPRSRSVGGWIPVSEIENLAHHAGVISITIFPPNLTTKNELGSLNAKLSPTLQELIKAQKTHQDTQQIIKRHNLKTKSGKIEVEFLFRGKIPEMSGMQLTENQPVEKNISRAFIPLNKIEEFAIKKDVVFVTAVNSKEQPRTTRGPVSKQAPSNPAINKNNTKTQMPSYMLPLGIAIVLFVIAFVSKWKRKRDYFKL